MISINHHRIKPIIKLYLIEYLRNYSVLISNTLIPVVFFISSLIIKFNTSISQIQKEFLINQQFFSTAIMVGIFNYSFTLFLISLCDIKENQTLAWVKQTGLKKSNFLLGNKIANLILLNAHILSVIFLFSLSGYLTINIIVKTLILSNLTFFIINAISSIFSKIISNKTLANNISTILMLILMFSLTLSPLISPLLNFNPTIIKGILAINPLFGYYQGISIYSIVDFIYIVSYLIGYLVIINTLEYLLTKDY